IYACVQGTGDDEARRVVVIDPATKKVETVATQVRPNDLVVSRHGFLYFTDTDSGQVLRVPLSARGMSRPPPVAGGMKRPNGIALSPDHRQLWVSEYEGAGVWSLLIEENGS